MSFDFNRCFKMRKRLVDNLTDNYHNIHSSYYIPLKAKKILSLYRTNIITIRHRSNRLGF